MGSIIEVIKRKPLIDGLSEKGEKPEARPKGNIELKDVNFCYPSRPNVKVCFGYLIAGLFYYICIICMFTSFTYVLLAGLHYSCGE
jgi:hypothetical protein